MGTHKHIRTLFCATAVVLLQHVALAWPVTIESNIVYATGSINASTIPTNKPLYLDAYYPAGAPSGRRTLVLVHGGGFISGDRTSPDMVEAANYFAERGWVCFSIQYRLLGDDPPAPFPYSLDPFVSAIHAAMVDSKRAVRWAREHAATYQSNTNLVAGLGHSAGAYCVIQSVISDEDDYANDAGTSTPDQWPGHSGKVNAGIDVSGGGTNSLGEIDSLDSPLMIWHSDSDEIVSYTEATLIHGACVSNQVPVRMFTIPGVSHGNNTWVATHGGRGVKQHAEEFLNLFFDLNVTITPGTNAVTLSWPSVTNALYDVQHSTNLLTSFTNLISDVRSTGDAVNEVAPAGERYGFYRLRIRSGQ